MAPIITSSIYGYGFRGHALVVLCLGSLLSTSWGPCGPAWLRNRTKSTAVSAESGVILLVILKKLRPCFEIQLSLQLGCLFCLVCWAASHHFSCLNANSAKCRHGWTFFLATLEQKSALLPWRAQSAFMTASEVRAPTFYRQEGLLMKNKQGEVCKGSYEMSAFFFFEFYSLGTSLFKSAGTYLSVGKAVTAPSKVLNN